MDENKLGSKQDQMDDYQSMNMDSLQIQINALRVKIEVLERRMTRQGNRLAIYRNDENGDYDV